MTLSLSTLPDLPTLTRGLTAALNSHGLIDGGVEIIDREINSYAGGSPSEIVKCRLADGSELRLLCKYQASSGETWSDVAYEVEIYRHLLQPLQAGTPAFYGTYQEEDGRTWLILEYLDDGLSLEAMADPNAAAMVAGWLGRFHAASAEHLASGEMPFLKVYNAEYYAKAGRSALRHAAKSHHQFPWLATLRQRFDELVANLCGAEQTIIHGDFHLSNLLCRHGMIYPIDWEMAGISAGEIDLACLIDGWPEIEQPSAQEYQQARWPQGAPADFEQRVYAARIAMYFYKLRNHPHWTNDPHFAGDRDGLRAAGEGLGLI